MNKIRNFSYSSLRYPVIYNKPVYTFTTTYKFKKPKKKPKMEIYIDGPFYPNTTLPLKESQKELKTTIFNTLTNRSLNSNYEFVKYIKKEKTW